MRENNKIKKFLKEILKDLDELKAADIVTIDIKDRSALADYLIIASGKFFKTHKFYCIKNNQKK